MIFGRLLRTTARRWIAAALVACIAVSLLIAAQVATAAKPIEPTAETIAVPAGPGSTSTIDLDASLFLPSQTPAPAVIVAHGFGGSKNSVAEDAQRLAKAGFVVLTYSARGFGHSGGQIALDSLDYEVADARELVTWLAHRPEVTQDGPGDPRVGVTGGSYGGALSLMLAGTDRRVDAVAAVATWNNLEQALFPNNIATAKVGGQPPSPSVLPSAPTPAFIPPAADGVFKQQWTATLLTSILATGSSAAPSSNGESASKDGDDVSPGSAAGPSGTASPGSAADAVASCGRLMPQLCAAYTQVAVSGRVNPAMTSLLANSSPSQVVSNITAPTLLVQGEQDTLFGLDQADANARAIAKAGTPVAVSWYPGGHSGGGLDTRSQDRITDWLSYYLAGRGAKPSTAFQYAVAGSVSQRGTPRVRTLEVASYPGLAGTTTPRHSVALQGGPQLIVNPPGGQPAAITSLPGVGSLASSALGALSALPGQTAEFTSKPLAEPAVVTGSATVTLKVSRVPAPDALTGAAAPARDGADNTSAVLFLSLVAADGSSDGNAAAGAGGDGANNGAAPSGTDGGTGTAQGDTDGGTGTAQGDTDGDAVSPTGSDASATTGSDDSSGTPNIASVASLLGSGAAGGAVAPIRIPDLPADGTPVVVTVHLPAVAFQVDAGKAIGVRVATTDQGFPELADPAAFRVSLAGGSVELPEAGGRRIDTGENPLGWAIGLAAILLLGVAALIVVGRPRKDVTPVVSQADGDAPVPLVVSGLKKQYPGGVVAVADVSFAVERGQVLGLLGPNGAGKTTTLRMVMGLIAPTAGDVRLFGEPVEPGAPVLARVGSFVEGSGFLPHLSGKANLDLYWRGTGRGRADSFMGEALEIAGLGGAIKRKVRTYSQGMRQRLAIAQAMLGLPDLLILDEPTNGLDPPQIHAMREVLRRYAATGRTVVVSSHLLSEVEQTCTDVVIVSKGRTIAAGTVTELVSHSADLVVSTTEPDKARSALMSLPGIGEIGAVPGGVVVDRGHASASDLMRALLDGDVAVTAIAPRNRLEEVFLDLIAAGEGTAP